MGAGARSSGTNGATPIAVAGSHVPARLAELHARTPVGVCVKFSFPEPVAARIDDLVLGAGFETAEDRTGQVVVLRRLRSLPDHVGPDMRVLTCGLNPSLYAADRGVNFARPGNRFWPAMLAAGLVTVDRDPTHALTHHGIGMTDLVKRATVAASELTRDEFVAGVARVERLCRWLRPRVLCVVGLRGWRVAVDRRAVVGWQAHALGGTPVYVMPNTSGLNASTQHAGFVAHLRAATDQEDRVTGSGS